jgi:hypothetical protein
VGEVFYVFEVSCVIEEVWTVSWTCEEREEVVKVEC